MLKFYGIQQDQENRVLRFQEQLSLQGQLSSFMELYASAQGDAKQLQLLWKEALESHLADKESMLRDRQSFSVKRASLFRIKDLSRFVFENPDSTPLKLALARELVRPKSIEEKWESLMLVFKAHLRGFDPDLAAELLGDTASEFFLCLQWIALHFLEQDEELPPANLRLEFVRGRFPQTVWSRNGQQSEGVEAFWHPQNPLCKPHFLAHQLMRRLMEGESQALALREGVKLPPADQVLLKIGEDHGQLAYLEENPAESLLTLQRMVQQRFSFDGVRHLIAIFRQLGQARAERLHFSVSQHFHLLGLYDRQGQISSKQQTVFEEVFALLKEVKVRRNYHRAEVVRSLERPLILCQEEHFRGLSTQPDALTLLLDPLFEPSPSNPLRLGAHLGLLPEELFAESPNSHNLVLPLASYLTGTWVLQTQSAGRLQKSAEELVEGCALRSTSRSKTNLCEKLHSELSYMQQKGYIGAYQHEPCPSGNPWKASLTITAPEPMLGFFQSAGAQALTC